jgi:hypothetical protein
MATTAQVPGERNGFMSLRLNPAVVGVVLALVFQACAVVFAYGKMVERVDQLQNQVQEIRVLLLQRTNK